MVNGNGEGADYKQLLDEVFVISRIIEVEVGVVIRSRNLEIMHRGHNDYCIICSYDVAGAISKIHCKLSANQKRDSELNV